jgi:hypothetical protein
MNVVASPMFDLIKQTWVALKQELYVVFQRGDLFALPVPLYFVVWHNRNSSTPEIRRPYVKLRIGGRTGSTPEIAAGFPNVHDKARPIKHAARASEDCLISDFASLVAAYPYRPIADFDCFRPSGRESDQVDGRSGDRPESLSDATDRLLDVLSSGPREERPVG